MEKNKRAEKKTVRISMHKGKIKGVEGNTPKWWLSLGGRRFEIFKIRILNIFSSEYEFSVTSMYCPYNQKKIV